MSDNSPVVFKVGGVADGRSFFGRSKEVHELSAIFRTTSSYSLVGATRIGKNSLASKVFSMNEDCEGVIPVEINMSEFLNAYEFWESLWQVLIQNGDRFAAENPTYIRSRDRLLALTYNDPNWYTKMREPLKSGFAGLQQSGWRIVLALDEFDAVTRVFEGVSAYYQLLRTLFSNDKYGLNGVLLSRSNLKVLEAKEESISTFHGVFATLRLKGFNDSDMEDFYSALRTHNIELSEEARSTLKYYTGNIPYLCCMFANRIVLDKQAENLLVEEADIHQVYHILQPDIRTYYKDLVNRLEKDGHLEGLIYLAFDEMKTGEYRKHRDDMFEMGYLNVETIDGQPQYYAYSRDFMSYLRFMPLSMPTWELLTNSEKRLRYILSLEYDKLARVHLCDLEGEESEAIQIELAKCYQSIQFNWQDIKRYAKTLNNYKLNPSVLDVLTLTTVINAILCQWSAFESYFQYDSTWKERLELIKHVRNPIAHANEMYINDFDLTRCKQYCTDIINLLPYKDDCTVTCEPYIPQKNAHSDNQQTNTPSITDITIGSFVEIDYLGAFSPDLNNKIQGINGCISGKPEAKGKLHISKLTKLYVTQDQMSRFISILEKCKKLKVKVLSKDEIGYQFGLIGVDPSFDDIINSSPQDIT